MGQMAYFGIGIGLVLWLVLWPVTIICIVLQVLLSRTDGKYNGLIIPGFMFVIPLFFSMFAVRFGMHHSLVNTVFNGVLSLISCALVPGALYILYMLLHEQYRKDKYQKDKYQNVDEKQMKIKDL